MEKLLPAIKATFPAAAVSQLSADSKLSAIPGWDSMNAINLLLEIETAFGCSGLTLEFSDDLTLGQLRAELAKRGLPVE